MSWWKIAIVEPSRSVIDLLSNSIAVITTEKLLFQVSTKETLINKSKIWEGNIVKTGKHGNLIRQAKAWGTQHVPFNY